MPPWSFDFGLVAEQKIAGAWFEIGPQYSPGLPEYLGQWVESFYNTFLAHAPSLRVFLLPIFQEQTRIDNAKRLWGFLKKPSKHLTVFSPETVNVYKMVNLTANTKNGQITKRLTPFRPS